MSSPTAKPDKDTRNLVEFKYGDEDSPTYRRYTDWDTDLYFEGNKYVSTPSLEFVLPEMTGTITDEKADIYLPEDDFVVRACGLEPHSEIEVSIKRLVNREPYDAPEVMYLYDGEVQYGEANPEGKEGRYHFECLTWKSSLDVKAGAPAVHQCVNAFGSGIGCQYNRRANSEIGTITAILGNRVTIAGLTVQTNAHWNKGTIKKDGIEIDIRKWSEASQTIFYLASFPPSDWLNSAVRVFPGCERTVVKCGHLGQLENFNGFGRKIPKHHPNTETPGGG